MASRYYVGTTGDLTLTASWSATRGGASGASVPVSDDDVFIEALDHAIATNTSAFAAVNLGSLTISVVGGGSIDGLNFGVSGTSSISRSGEARISMAAGAGPVKLSAGTDGIDDLHVTNTSGSEFELTSGTALEAYFRGGANRIKSAAAVSSNLHNLNSTLFFADGSATVGTVFNYNGFMLLERSAFSALNVYGGFVQIGSTVESSGTIYIYGSGAVRYLGAPPIGTLNLYEGATIDDIGNTTGFTVTTSRAAGNVSFFQNPSSTITYTNPTVIWPLKP